MASTYYDPLIAKWPTLTPGTTAAKLTQINAITVAGAATPMIVPTYKIYNLIDPTEWAAVSAANQQLIRDILGMGSVDASPGTQVRARISAIFAAGTVTRTALLALAATFDTPPIPWWKATVAQSGGALNAPVGANDLVAAGGLV